MEKIEINKRLMDITIEIIYKEYLDITYKEIRLKVYRTYNRSSFYRANAERTLDYEIFKFR